MNSTQKLIAQLAAPEAEYRPRCYWGWLENITPEETIWQIDRMAEVGLGGYVMHARGGLTMPYAGSQWMDSVRAMIKRGQEKDMLTIIDDEHGWPSGFGAGHVNGKGEKYQLKYLLCEEIRAGDADASDLNTLGLWNREDFSPVSDPKALKTDTSLIRVYKKIDPYYVDNMDPDVVDAFIDASYEDYHRKLGSLEGVCGIFSDEPQTARYATPWTDILPALYLKKYEKELQPQLYKLFYPAEDCAELRIAVYSLMETCFAENYAHKLYAWCTAHGTAFMGHTCGEELFWFQLRCSLGTMPFYEYMTVPGIDFLTRGRVPPLLTLQLTSVAQQLGKRRALCEMFGCAGWNISFQEMKGIAQRMAAFGVNDQLQHLGLYSLRGSRKREYPASIHYQQPWYACLADYNQYFARLSKLLSESRLETDLLIIHPMQSAWALYDGTESSTDELQARMDALLDTALELNLSPHLGDDTILARHGRVEGNALIVGRVSYRTVLLPNLISIARTTLELIRAFVAGGGRLLCAGSLPSMVDGVIEDISLPCEFIGDNAEKLSSALTPPARLWPSPEDAYMTRWTHGEDRYLYIVNNAEEPMTTRLEAEGTYYEYDPMDNALSDIPVDKSNISLAGGQAMLLFTGEPSDRKAVSMPYTFHKTLDGDWRIASMTDNALPLDHAYLSFDGEHWEAEAYILDIQQRLISAQKNRTVYLKYAFDSDIQAELLLLMENPQACAITVNGEAIGSRSVGWRIDKSLEAIPILCKTGHNEIILQREFINSERVYFVKNTPMHEAESNRVTVETELEAVYLLGAFSVRREAEAVPGPHRTLSLPGSYHIGAAPDNTSIENLVAHGFPFFAGTITLEKALILDAVPSHARLRFEKPDAIVTGILINGRRVKNLYWAPYEADITGYLQEGENSIQIELTNSLRNLFGPFYAKEGESYAVGPGSFGKEAPNKQVVRFGIESGVTIDWA